MPTTVDPAEFSKRKNIPWSDFTNREVWEVTHKEAEGYSGSVQSFHRTLYSYARRNALKVTVRTYGEHTRFQFKEKK